MAHSVHRQIKNRTVNEFIREIEENGRRVGIKKANSEGMTMYTQGVTMSYWQKKQTLVLQDKNEAILAIDQLFE